MISSAAHRALLGSAPNPGTIFDRLKTRSAAHSMTIATPHTAPPVGGKNMDPSRNDRKPKKELHGRIVQIGAACRSGSTVFNRSDAAEPPRGSSIKTLKTPENGFQNVHVQPSAASAASWLFSAYRSHFLRLYSATRSGWAFRQLRIYSFLFFLASSESFCFFWLSTIKSSLLSAEEQQPVIQDHVSFCDSVYCGLLCQQLPPPEIREEGALSHDAQTVIFAP